MSQIIFFSKKVRKKPSKIVISIVDHFRGIRDFAQKNKESMGGSQIWGKIIWGGVADLAWKKAKITRPPSWSY